MSPPLRRVPLHRLAAESVSLATPAPSPGMPGAFTLPFLKRACAALLLLFAPCAAHGSGFRLGSQSAVTFITNVNHVWQEIYVFVTDLHDGHLHVNYWDGTWHWGDLGKPGTLSYGEPAVGLAGNGYGVTGMYVFVGGENGHLYVDHWGGPWNLGVWNWADQGAPPFGGALGSTPSVAISNTQVFWGTYPSFVSFLTNGGHIGLNVSESEYPTPPSNWSWFNEWVNPPAVAVGRPATLLNVEPDNQTGPVGHTFAQGGDGHLHVSWTYQNCVNASWSDLGAPLGPLAFGGMISAVSYFKGTTNERMFAFLAGANGHLYRNSTTPAADSTQPMTYHWFDHGPPPGTLISPSSGPSAATYLGLLGPDDNPPHSVRIS